MARAVTTVSAFSSGENTKEEMVEEQSLMKTSMELTSRTIRRWTVSPSTGVA